MITLDHDTKREAGKQLGTKNRPAQNNCMVTPCLLTQFDDLGTDLKDSQYSYIH
jgi:hypothetical protein